jgi:N-acyl-D-amino-acid deacylase
MPPWVQEGGHDAWLKRLRDPEARARLKREMSTPSDEWESSLIAAGGPENVLLVSFKTDSLKYLTGKTLADVASMRRTSPEETAMDLVVQDDSRIGVIYFTMSEDNVRREAGLPWVSFGSDEASLAPEGVFLKSQPHPRAYGCFARVLGHFVRDLRVATLEEVIRRMTAFPAANLGLTDRGSLAVGQHADVVAFDAEAIQDHATYEQPHQYATGMRHVLVNGTAVLLDGEHTDARPGRVVRGSGAKKH